MNFDNNFDGLVRHRDNCRGCCSPDLLEFLDLGEMPLAGGFLATESEFKSELKIPLKIFYCRNCSLAQVLDVVNPDVLFKKYQYISSVIPALSEHFREYSAFLRSTYLKNKNSTLLEFGCNDGVLLQYFQNDKDIAAYGIDPSTNVFELARVKKLKVANDYFNVKSAEELKAQFGKMDVVTGSNVFAHVDDIHEILDAARVILKPDGVFIVEVHYLMNLLRVFQYDTIYHEHLSYYSVKSLREILKLKGFRLIDVQALPMHGGAIRAIATLDSSELPISPAVDDFLKDEKESVNEDYILRFTEKVTRHREELFRTVNSIKKQGKRIFGYGAAGRGTILLNYCGIGLDHLDYIVDASPLRAGKFMPGVHVPIVYPEKARNDPPDYFLVIAWNYLDSIMEQEKELKNRGVGFIVPFPEIRVIEGWKSLH